jgi:diaminopimelate epimerase
VGREVAVQLPGGTLQVSWAGAGQPLWMSGPAEFVFEGEFIA